MSWMRPGSGSIRSAKAGHRAMRNPRPIRPAAGGRRRRQQGRAPRGAGPRAGGRHRQARTAVRPHGHRSPPPARGGGRQGGEGGRTAAAGTSASRASRAVFALLRAAWRELAAAPLARSCDPQQGYGSMKAGKEDLAAGVPQHALPPDHVWRFQGLS